MDFTEIIPVKGGNLPSDFMFYKNEEAISVQRYLVFRVGCSFMEIIRKSRKLWEFFPSGGPSPSSMGILLYIYGPSRSGPAVDTRVLIECFLTFLIINV